MGAKNQEAGCQKPRGWVLKTKGREKVGAKNQERRVLKTKEKRDLGAKNQEEQKVGAKNQGGGYQRKIIKI